MSRLGINTGTNPNDGQGDPLRVAMGKINSNFLEIYNTFGNGSTITSYASTAGISTVAQNLTGSPRINVSGILNTGITTTEHIQVVNITSTGVVTATQFKGDGSQLTNVTSTASGVSIYDDGVLLGVARELDFDANIVSTSPDGTQRVKISATGLASAGYVAVAGYSTSSGIATNVIGGISSVTQLSVSGVSTFAGITTVTGVSLFTRQLSVSGVSTFAGITTYTASLFGTQGSFSGVVTASSFRGDGSQLTGIVASGSGIVIIDDGSLIGTAGTINFGSNLSVSPVSAGVVTVSAGSTSILNSDSLRVSGVSTFAGVSTFQSNLFGTQASFTGVVTASSFIGGGSGLTGLTGASANTYGNATAVPQIVVDANGRISSITNVLISGGGGGGSSIIVNDSGSLVGSAGTIDFGSGISVTPVSVGIVTVNVTYSPTAGIATYATTAGVSTTSTTSGYATTAGIATVAQGLTGTPNLNVGVVTATSFIGDGSGLTNLPGGGGGSSQWVTVASGIYTGSNVGIGTTLPTSKLTVEGNARFSGVVTATRFESTSAGTPTIDSPNNLNINAVTVAISTDLTVGGDAYIGVNTSRGLILSSPNGTQYRLVVDNSGNLTTVLVP
jgi:hypothetical protein